jgi:hypothetical protein
MTGRKGIGAADDAIIRAVGRFDYLIAEQACRLLYSRGSLTYVRARLSGLANARYLHRSLMPKASRAGSTPSVYTLGPKGHAYLDRHGKPGGSRLRSSEIDDASGAHLRHALGITDFLVACDLFCRANPEYRIRRILTDRELKRAQFRVDLPGQNGSRSGVAPDAWVEFRRRLEDGTAAQRCVALEFDNASEHQGAWRNKVERLVAWARGPYVEYFGTPALVIAVVTTGGLARRNDLVQWTGRSLEQHEELGAGRYFYISEASPAEMNPSQFFLANVWHQPCGEAAVPLLTGPS